ncbi:DNA translocase FtsK 4TM domain-containing protein [Patescibacteria group bacterium]
MPKKKNKKGKKEPILHRETKQGIIAIACFSFALISLLSFFEAAGVFGRYFYKLSRLFFGRGFFLATIGFILIGLAIITSRFKIKKGRQIIYQSAFFGVSIFVISVLGFFHIFAFPRNNFEQGLSSVILYGGGYLGLAIGYPLINFLGFWAGLIILITLLIISILVFFNVPLSFLKKKAIVDENKDKDKNIIAEEEPEIEEDKKGLFDRIKQRASQEMQKINEPIKDNEEEHLNSIPVKAKFAVQNSNFKLPSLDFLSRDKGQPTSGDIKANINIIKRTLENFGIEVEMAEVNVGPTVTQYTLRPAQGVKLSKIIVLQNDLSLALAAHPLRIEAPIPGRSLVGIEIPNKSVVTVRLGGLLEKKEFQEGALLSFALGRDVAGNPVFADLAKMPHMLIAGATGSGKTIALNNVITSLLYKNSPESLKLILIDPKRVELTAYESIPQLLAPVIVQSDKAVGALRWAVGEMERRFEILHKAGKRDIGAYIASCQESKNSENEKLPFIVVVIDELADLMSTNGKEAEAAIVRLAQMARAIGIHLIVSTQRPSVEVITGLIKANITSRIAFQVASQIDSRTILDMAGADKLLGNGDMLFLSGNSAKPRRIQGAYISDKEVKKITDYLRESESPDYQDDVISGHTGGIAHNVGFNLDSANFDSGDELYEDAKIVVTQAGKASASLLQRRLRVGYARAARLLDILEEQGVVGPADGARPRDVYIDEGADKFNN